MFLRCAKIGLQQFTFILNVLLLIAVSIEASFCPATAMKSSTIKDLTACQRNVSLSCVSAATFVLETDTVGKQSCNLAFRPLASESLSQQAVLFKMHNYNAAKPLTCPSIVLTFTNSILWSTNSSGYRDESSSEKVETSCDNEFSYVQGLFRMASGASISTYIEYPDHISVNFTLTSAYIMPPDETKCPSDMFACTEVFFDYNNDLSGSAHRVCVPDSLACDEVVNCPGGTDEEVCNLTALVRQFPNSSASLEKTFSGSPITPTSLAMWAPVNIFLVTGTIVFFIIVVLIVMIGIRRRTLKRRPHNQDARPTDILDESPVASSREFLDTAGCPNAL